MSQTVLILGGSGRFGRHATIAFATAGWEVRQFNRASDNLWDAAWGADVIVNAWHMAPQDWAAQVPKLHAEVREVALASGATVIIPGNIYAFGDTMPEVLNADTPQLPSTPYGQVRKDMEAAYRRDGVRTIILRAGDFLDDAPSGNWFDRIMTAKLAKGVFVYPGPTDVSHAWAFLPDMARAAVALAEMRHDLSTFEDIPYAGLTLTGQEMQTLLEQIAGTPLRTRRFPWVPVRLTALFLHLSRYLAAMKYLWDRPHRLDGTRLAQLLPDHRDSSALSALAAAAQPQIHPDKRVARAAVTQ
ncbi:MAG: epimerase [Pseudomonadota bacterium]